MIPSSTPSSVCLNSLSVLIKAKRRKCLWTVFSPDWLPDRSNNSLVTLMHHKYQDSLHSLWLKKACHCSYHRWCRLLGTLFFFYPPPYCWQPVLLHTFSYNRQQKCFLFHVTAIINLTGQSANNSCCTVFNCSRASWEQHKHPPLLMKQTCCESCVTYLPLYLILRGKHRCACCTQMPLKKLWYAIKRSKRPWKNWQVTQIMSELNRESMRKKRKCRRRCLISC